MLCAFLLTTPFFTHAQDTTVQGTIVDIQNNPVWYVNVLVLKAEDSTAIKGAVSGEDGTFLISGLKQKDYILEVSSIGYIGVKRKFSIPRDSNLGSIVLEEDTEQLEETVITLKRPTIKKTAGKLIFNVENTTLSTGDTFGLLKKTPGVLVIGEDITVKFNSPVVYINEKRVYLSQSELVTYLKNLDASIIKSVEVITNPTAKYDADASSVLNINTTRAVSVGYKGSVSSRMEQAVYSKYNIGTAHFYKNNWLNFFGSYSFSPRKEFKDQDDEIRFFNPGGSTKSFWTTDFNRTTRSYGHQANMIADMIINKKNTISVSFGVSASPNKTFNNRVTAEIFDATRQLDSTFNSESTLENDRYNVMVNLEHKLRIGEKGARLATSGNYIIFDNRTEQAVGTNYFSPNQELIRRNSFLTNATQESEIVTLQFDFSSPALEGTFQTGMKYSNIDTRSGLDFFNTNNGMNVFDQSLSDDFNYKESIFAAYVDFSREWESLQMNLGVRGEQTDVQGISLVLGEVNTQTYFELFPSASLQYTINDANSIGASYARRIQRPRYQSLNPFKYFLTENNFVGGNPNLNPSIDNKFAVSYALKDKWFFDLYYQVKDNTLGVLTFQDNENSLVRSIDSNLISDFQYSFDVVYASSILSWCYLSLVTSTYYLENEFFSVESNEETYVNNTFGFFGQVYAGLTLSKEHKITSDVTAVYISNLISGSYNYGNQFNLSISFRKSLWGRRASITMGVDDIFNTYNIPVTSRYYNQDFLYFSKPESRLFRIGFRYNFGNNRLRDNNRRNDSDEGDRLY